MIHTFTCPHGTTELLIGSNHQVYCRQCKQLIYSVEEITKREMSLNYDKQKPKHI